MAEQNSHKKTDKKSIWLTVSVTKAMEQFAIEIANATFIEKHNAMRMLIGFSIKLGDPNDIKILMEREGYHLETRGSTNRGNRLTQSRQT